MCTYGDMAHILQFRNSNVDDTIIENAALEGQWLTTHPCSQQLCPGGWELSAQRGPPAPTAAPRRVLRRERAPRWRPAATASCSRRMAAASQPAVSVVPLPVVPAHRPGRICDETVDSFSSNLQCSDIGSYRRALTSCATPLSVTLKITFWIEYRKICILQSASSSTLTALRLASEQSCHPPHITQRITADISTEWHRQGP